MFVYTKFCVFLQSKVKQRNNIKIKTTMKTKGEIYIAATRLYEATLVEFMNYRNGCPTTKKDDVETLLGRVRKAAEWCKANDKFPEFKCFASSRMNHKEGDNYLAAMAMYHHICFGENLEIYRLREKF